MSFLGSIVSDIKSVATDPGKLVGDVANSILPSNMNAVGDILGGITDIETGNPLAALSHMTDALKDLPQLMQALSSAAGGTGNATKPAGTAAAEPSPPPKSTTASPPAASTPASTPATTPAPAATPATATTKAQTPTVTVTNSRGATMTQVDDGTNTTRVTERANGITSVVVMNDATGKTVGGYTGSASNISVAGEHVTVRNAGGQNVTTIDNGANTARVSQNGANATISVSKDTMSTASPGGLPGMIATIEKLLQAQKTTSTSSAGTAMINGAAAPATAAKAAAPSGTASTASASGQSTTAGTSSSSNSSGTSASSSSSSTPAGLQSLMAMSPDQFMQAVTSGKIPPDVANDQSAMMQVQARMNQITQMNQLVTSMMAAAHQMQMSIIQNIRC
jgi:hypothetical protein